MEPWTPARDSVNGHLAHDIRGLLACVQVVVEELHTLDPKLVASRAAKLQTAINRIVDYCSNYGVREECCPDHLPNDLRDVLADAAEFLRLLAAGRPIEIALSADHACISAAAATAIHRIVINLGRNAIAAMSRIKGSSLEVRATVHHQQIHICVIDDGPGLPETILQQLFPPFHTPYAASGRIGLGLPSSRRLAAELGGDLILLRSSRHGAAFRIILPHHQRVETSSRHSAVMKSALDDFSAPEIS